MHHKTDLYFPLLIIPMQNEHEEKNVGIFKVLLGKENGRTNQGRASLIFIAPMMIIVKCFKKDNDDC